MAWHISDASSFDPKIYVILFALFHFSFTGVEGLGSSLFLPKGNKKGNIYSGTLGTLCGYDLFVYFHLIKCLQSIRCHDPFLKT